MLAKEQGYDQVIWTDSNQRRYIDEAGMMNIMFVIDEVLVTPSLRSAILDGVTHDSIIKLTRRLNLSIVQERRITVAEVAQALKSGTLTEACGVGTAAVIAPISVIGIEGENYPIPAPGPTSLQTKLKSHFYKLGVGITDDKFGWNYPVTIG